ncbi:MAG: S8 family serine peptidase [Acidimicrobiales bacterium]
MPPSIRRFLALAVGLLSVAAAPASVDARVEVNDPVFTQGLQWALERIGAPDAWSRATGRGVTIAIVDSGVDLQHEDLRGKVVGAVSCIGSNGTASRCSGSAQDDNGHGTHVAGIALATTDNGLGVAGVAPNAKLLAVRVLANHCDGQRCTASGSQDDVSAGIRWAVDHGADIVNLSLGSDGVDQPLSCSLCSAIDYAWSKGVIAVLAAGNDATNQRSLPTSFASEPAVVVTATTRDDAQASYSNSSASTLHAARWPVAAPGGEAETKASDCGSEGTPKGVLSSYWVAGQPSQYACLAGTSMATPHVSGALAVLLSAGHTPQGAIDRLLATAKDLGPSGRDDSFGFGRIDLARAAGATSTPSTTRPTLAPTTTTRPRGTTAPRPASTSTVPDTTSSLLPDPADDGEAPRVSLPEISTAAPFKEGGADPAPPAPLVAGAIFAIVASALGTAATAWRLSRA